MLPEILTTIDETCNRVGRNPASVKLIAVTKGHSLEEIRACVLSHGDFALGENRVQEALPKLEALPEATFHLIGHLQSNKVKFCRDFKLVQGIDGVRLLEELAKRGEGWGFVPPVLLEVNIAREPQKHGLMPEEAPVTLRAAQALGIDVRGLMTVAPQMTTTAGLASQVEVAGVRQVFRELRFLRDSLGLEELSMGMSDDYQLAIEEGATMLRIGRKLFT